MPNTCIYCNNTYPSGAPYCLACAKQVGSYPNVELAQAQTEQTALHAAYTAAYRDAEKRNAVEKLRQFDAAVSTAKMVTCCDLSRLYQLVERENCLYPVYLNLVRANILFPGDNLIDSERLIAEESTFPGCAREIRYAALTLNDSGATNYGAYLLFWKEDLTSYRASVFTDNCVMWRKRNGISLDAVEIPHGNRAPWDQRNLLAVSKYANKITEITKENEFCTILLSSVPGSPNLDEFIEVHIWGPLTKYSLAKVIIANDNNKQSKKGVRNTPDALMEKCMLRKVKENLASIGVLVESGK